MPTIHQRCADAAQQLFADPSLRPVTTGPPGIFTDFDVLILAAGDATRDGESFNEDGMKIATREASEVLSRYWRGGRLARFGPVMVPGLNVLDYMRIAGKIVYVTPDGPQSVITPNGTFPRFFTHEDEIPRRAGRRSGTARNDLQAWDNQNIVGHSAPTPISPERREIARLKAELEATRKLLIDTQTECDRLREINAQLLVRGADRDEVVEITESRLTRGHQG